MHASCGIDKLHLSLNPYCSVMVSTYVVGSTIAALPQRCSLCGVCYTYVLLSSSVNHAERQMAVQHITVLVCCAFCIVSAGSECASVRVSPASHNVHVLLCLFVILHLQIQCDSCDMWVHTACDHISEQAYSQLGDNSSEHYYCPKCKPKFEARHAAHLLQEQAQVIAHIHTLVVQSACM